ncbi:hypothetical protein OJAV_G00193970 [Oryzias javanicus]|uniref:Uncharacterized protein n=1 Tax=Oryzias javanicus TaxID=123683 RepID=A0A437CC77_ORYJA|nr:hypothetical protein OJAV_G00193970 [Oryzias javanicus]
MRVWFQADISWSWREDAGMFGTNPEDQRAENRPGWTASDRIFCSFNKHQKCGDFHKRMKICGRLSTRLHHLLQFLKPPLGAGFPAASFRSSIRTVDFLFNPHGFPSHHNQDADREPA